MSLKVWTILRSWAYVNCMVDNLGFIHTVSLLYAILNYLYCMVYPHCMIDKHKVSFFGKRTISKLFMIERTW